MSTPTRPQSTDPLPPPPNTAAERELALIQTVLRARGWECVDVRADGDWLRLAARRHFPTEPINLANLDR